MATRMSQTCAPYSHNKKSFIVGSDVLRMRMSSGMWRAPYALQEGPPVQEGPSCTGGCKTAGWRATHVA